jgi:cholest-4-en-3-one 26-monooxygenase
MLDDVDLWNLDQFVDGSVADVFRRLRAEAPVWWHDRPGGEPFWAVTRMEHARTVFRDPVVFSSQANGVMVRDAETLGQLNPAQALGIHPMIHTDPPRHVQLRKLVSRRFTPRSIAELEAQIRGYAVECMDEVADRRDVDFVTDIAHRIPAAITFALLDVPESEWGRLAELEHRTIARSDPEFVDGVSAAQSAAAAGSEIFGYFAQLVQARLEEPGDDLLSQFIRGRIDGEQLPWEQVVAEAGLLLAGGLDTTRAAASAGAMLPLLRDRAQLRALWDDVSLLATGVEEFVRWASPVVSEMRTATCDVELGGQTIRAGERVVVWGASCNRDEAVFDDADRFDLRRDPNPHIGFSFGEHFCLGAHLARLTLRVEFETLVERFADVELVGEPVRVRSNFVGGLKHLPVRLVPR